jgi:hypothetical protein
MARAQKASSNNIDTVYYFIDTAGTPLKDRMWEVGIESNIKYFTSRCPCLKNNQGITFFYRLKNSGKKIDKNAFNNINTIDLASLLSFGKKATDLTATTLYVYFFIEKNSDKEFVIHEAKIYRPREGMKIIDYENIPADKVKRNN